MPSADEINAYLEASAARTKLRLPLAKGNALPVSPTPQAASGAARALPLASAKKLPTRREEPLPSVQNAASGAAGSGADQPAGEAWQPFSLDDER